MSTGSTTASGASRFIRQVAGTLGVRVGIAGCNFLSGAIVARWLGPAEFGIFSALNVVMMLAVTTGIFGQQSAITFLVARDRSVSRSVFINSIIFALAAGTSLVLVTGALAWRLPHVFGNIPPELVTIAAAAIPFQLILYFCMAFYLGFEDIRAYNKIDIAMQTVTLVNALVFLIAVGYGLKELVIGIAAVNVAISLIVVVKTATTAAKTAGTWRPDWPILQEMRRYGLRFFIAIIAGMIILRGDLLILNYYRSAEETAFYAVATIGSLFLHMVPNVISVVLFPRTSGAGDESGRMTCRVTRHAVFFVFFACLATAPFSLLFPVVYTPAFAPATALFLALLPGVWLLGIETIMVQHFSGLGLPRQVPIFWIVTMVFCVGLDFVFVPAYGAMAAAIISTASYGLIFLLITILFLRKTGRSISETFLMQAEDFRGLKQMYRKITPGEELR